jgi:hypothetical protein
VKELYNEISGFFCLSSTTDASLESITMLTLPKMKRQSQTNLSKPSYSIRVLRIWKDACEELSDESLGNIEGRVHSKYKNMMVLLSLIMLLN